MVAGRSQAERKIKYQRAEGRQEVRVQIAVNTLSIDRYPSTAARHRISTSSRSGRASSWSGILSSCS